MLAVDTNVVVRLLTADEPVQAARARAIFERETVLLVKTVVLETQWVSPQRLRLRAFPYC
jgi:predicted nucleic acid-binding protein